MSPIVESIVDGYWIKMGGLACEALTDVLLADLTPRRKEIIAEYLGEMFANAYEMGIKLGRAQERYVINTSTEGSQNEN